MKNLIGLMRHGGMDNKYKKSLSLNEELQTHLKIIGIPVCKRLDLIWLRNLFSRNYLNTRDENIIEARRLVNELCELKGL